MVDGACNENVGLVCLRFVERMARETLVGASIRVEVDDDVCLRQSS